MVVGNLNASEGCEVLVIGAGPGGYVCAIRLAQLGKDVILVDSRSSLGGVCLNEGCIPSKAIIHAAETYEQMKHSKKMGLMLPQEPKVDMSVLQKWKKGIVSRLTKGVASLEKSHGVRVMNGKAKFVESHRAELQNEQTERSIQIQFEQAVIATGTLPNQIPSIPYDGDFVIGSKEALELDVLPPKLVVVGGGYIGLELGTAFCKLGSDVTVVEVQHDLLGGQLEPEIHQAIRKRAKFLGIKVLTEHSALFAISGNPGTLVVKDSLGKEKNLEADKVIIAVGRRPYTDSLGLDALGLSLDKNGFFQVNACRQTALPHIYAIGDVTGQPMLAHKAYREAKVAAEVIAGHPAAYDVRVCPAVMFTDPEVATVGFTEAQAKASGHQVVTGLFPLKASGRALTLDASEGFAKIVTEAESQRLLGVHLVGPHVAEMISEGTLAIEMDAFLDDIANTIHPHPTLNEALLEAAELALGSCAHFRPAATRSSSS